MPLRDEKVFSDAEMIAAFSIILPPEQARREALAFNAFPDYTGFEDATPAEIAAAGVSGPRSYDGDILDLLSLLSDSCAERAWNLLGITSEEGVRRRERFKQKVEIALRGRR